MDAAPVIARGYRGIPLHRVALGAKNGLIYIANPDLLEAIQAGDSEPVGFPAEDVFRYDPETAERLAAEWREHGRTDPATWEQLQPYRP